MIRFLPFILARRTFRFSKNTYVRSARLAELIRKEKKTPFEIDYRKKVECWRNGFLSESSFFYDWNKYNKRDFVTDIERFIYTPDINGVHSIIIDDKSLFRKVFTNILPTPKNICTINKRGQIREDTGQTVGLEDLLKEHSSFVSKLTCGGGGSSIRVYERKGKNWLINGRYQKKSVLLDSLRKLPPSIIDEKVENSEYSKRINPFSLNTLRILTMIDPEDGQPFIARAIHRFGTSRSAPADNWTQGGVSSLVDKNTGALGLGATYPFDGKIQWHSVHPETKEKIEGVIVPNWKNIKEDLLSVAYRFSHVPYIGWDVVARNDGYIVIEGNSNTDINLLQIHGPLLESPRIRRFYKHHKALAPWRK